MSFSYNSFLGYKKGADGKPEIVEDEAKVVREIFDKYLEGESVRTIAKYLTANQIRHPQLERKCGITVLSNQFYQMKSIRVTLS